MSDLPNIPEIEFFDKDPQQLIADFKFMYEHQSGETITKASPVYNFITTIAAVIVLQRQQFDAALKQNFLLYAEDEKLDHLGLMRQTARFDAEGSKVTLEFTLSAAQTSAIIIPAGTRATADNNIFFALSSPVIIPAGQLKASGAAESIQTGAQSNNIDVGAINILVDRPPFVESVRNIDVSLGGRDIESDEAYRLRLYNAPSTYSTCGPRDAYVYRAKQASSAIGEVTVNTDHAGRVDVYPLLTNGEIPNAAIISLIQRELSEDTVRPLSDLVRVLAPTVVNYDVNLTYYIYTSDAGNVEEIQARVNKAIDDWVLWQRQKIGRDVNVSVLITRIVQAGAKRCAVTLPMNTVVGPSGLAVLRNKSVVFGGLEDE